MTRVETIPLAFDSPEGWIGIAVSKTNSFATEKMLAGAISVVQSAGSNHIRIIEVAGAFELIAATRALLVEGAIGVITLGAIIRGETPHFEYIASAVANGLAAMSSEGYAVSLGVLTTDTTEQAVARAGGAMGNKGAEAAEALVELVSAIRRLKSR